MDQEPVGRKSQVDSNSRRVAQVRAAAEPCSKAETVRRQQLTFFLAASTIAAVPVGLQVLALLAVWSTPAAFPHYDSALLGVRFWPVQIILVSLGLCGNALLDFTRAWAGGRNVAAVGIYPVAGTAGALLIPMGVPPALPGRQ